MHPEQLVEDLLLWAFLTIYRERPIEMDMVIWESEPELELAIERYRVAVIPLTANAERPQWEAICGIHAARATRLKVAVYRAIVMAHMGYDIKPPEDYQNPK